MTERTYGNCPECNYSATPNEILGRERKHHWPHSLECVRCGYRTETKQTWPLAIAAWNKQASDEQAAEIERLTAEVQSKNDQIGKLYTVCNEKAVFQNANERLREALKPFADSLTEAEKAEPSDHAMRLTDCRYRLTLYDFAKARTAYEQGEMT